MKYATISVMAFLSLSGAEARPACCETSDDGVYPCYFQLTDRHGSFRVTAKEKPTFILEVSAPGEAQGFVNFGDRDVSLPGIYRPSMKEPGCWLSDATGAKICAW